MSDRLDVACTNESTREERTFQENVGQEQLDLDDNSTTDVNEEIGLEAIRTPTPPETKDNNNRSSTVEDIERKGQETLEEEVSSDNVCIICHTSDHLHSCCDNLHAMCTACFVGYLNAEMVPDGAFEGVRQSKNNDVSPSGALPCPKFVIGECSTAAMSLTTLFGVLHLDPEAAKLYYLAMQRVYYHQHQLEHQLNLQQELDNGRGDGDDEEDGDAQHAAVIEGIRTRVMQALERGAVVNCPQCSAPGIKNDACVHMKCHLCATSWCYCCGRRRTNCRGRDSVSPYLEQQPNWGTFGLQGESPAQGALHEFHRQRQAYFVQDVKDSTTPYQWREFAATYAEILTNVPTLGRRVTWKELESPIRPPVFGSSNEEDLLWAHRPRPEAPTELEDLDTRNEEALPIPVPETVLATWSDTFSSAGGKRWLFLTFALLIPLNAVTWIPRLNLMTPLGFLTSLISATWTYSTAQFLVLRFADYCELFPERVWYCCLEVQLVGQRRHRPQEEHDDHDDDGEGGDREGPYYSASGRWRNERQKFVRTSTIWYCVEGYLLAIAGIYNIAFFFYVGVTGLVSSVLYTVTNTFLLNVNPLPPLTEAQGLQAQRTYMSVSLLLWYCQLLIGMGVALMVETLEVGSLFAMFGVAFMLALIAPYAVRNRGWQRPARSGRLCSVGIGIAVLAYCLLFFFVFSNGAAYAAIVVGPGFAMLCLHNALCITPRNNHNNEANENDEEEEEANVEDTNDIRVLNDAVDIELGQTTRG